MDDKPLTDEQLDRLCNKLYAEIAEMDRLGKLTARELVFETLERDAADDPHVTELMNRVFPGWTKEFSEEELEG